MNLDEIEKKCFILALFIRDDRQRFLLGSGAYEFKEKQLHFAANVMSNDVVEVQGNDGYMLAGQVRRPTTQVFDGYIGDATVNKQDIEGYRRDFFGFFQKNHFYTVVYIFPDGSAIQRRRGFIVDSAEVKELWQLFPEYHIGMNFEDINYYKYSENEEGEETYGSSAEIALSTEISGGLIWENTSEIQVNKEGTELEFTGTINNRAVDYIDLYGNSEQKTMTGKNLLPLTMTSQTVNDVVFTVNADGSIKAVGTATARTEPNLYQSGTGVPALVLKSGITYHNSMNTVLYFFSTTYRAIGANGNYTPSVDETVQYAYFRVENGESIDATLYPQLEKGSQGSAYEQYCGGTPSPNPDYPQEIKTVSGEQTIKFEDETQGKNLFNTENQGTVWQTTIISKTNNEIVLKPSAQGGGYVDFLIDAEKSTQYTFSAQLEATGFAGNFKGLLYFYSHNGSATSYIDSATVGYIPKTFTTKSDTKKILVRLYSLDGNDANWQTAQMKYSEIQIEKGSQYTPYEPYITQVYKIDLSSNKLWTSDFVIGGIGSGGQDLGRADRFNAKDFVEVEPSTTYTFSGVAGTSGKTVQVFMLAYDLSKSYIGQLPANQWYSLPLTFTTPNNCYYVKLSGRFSDDTTLGTVGNPTGALQQAQLEQGSSATPYYNYELCKIGDYQDYIYIDDGDYYIHKEITKIVFDSTTSWTADSTSGMFHLNSATSSPQNADDKIVIISDQFTGVAANDRTSGLANMIYKFASSLYIRNTSFANTSAVVSHFTSNPAVAYYVMRTATDTQITDAGLIAQLEALNSATCYGGITWIKSEATEHNLPATMMAYITVNAGGGIEWDENGAVWEAGGGGNTTIMINSIENVYPVWTVVGPATNPVLTNLTTGTSISYSGSVSSSQKLVIDMLNQTAKLNGTSVIGNVAGEWLEFIPGNNTVSYSADNADAPNSTIEWQEVVG